MGNDVENHWVHVRQGEDSVEVRETVMQCIAELATAMGYLPAASDPEAIRSFVIGPPDRWILVGDSADSLDLDERDPAPRPLDLPRRLSEIAPVISITGCDSACYRLRLFESGGLRDTFQNAVFPFFPFESVEAAAEFAGVPELWQPLLDSGHTVDRLRGLFVQTIRTWEAGSLGSGFLERFAVAFGMPEHLIEVGYTWNPDGVPVSYREFVEHLAEEPARDLRNALDGFRELHFRWPGQSGRGEWE